VAANSSVNFVVSKGPQIVTVPSIVGSTESQAATTLGGAGLTVGIPTEAYSSNVAVGKIISQTPTAGSSVAINSAVNYMVSKGIQMVFVPNVVGLTEAGAGSAITAVNLVVGSTTREYSSTISIGRVISQSVASGSSVTAGTSVNLVVSQGVQMKTVPNIVGLTEAEANTAILGAGLTVGSNTQSYNSTYRWGRSCHKTPLRVARLLLIVR